MSTRRLHLHSAGATRMRAAVVLPLLLLLLACAAAGSLCVRAVDTNSYEEAERTNTLAFLQSFVTPGSTLADVWTGTDFCKWTYITCEVSSVTLDLRELRPTAPLALPELANSVDGGGVLLTRIRADGLGSSLSGTLPASWSRLTQLTTVFLAGNALTGPLPGAWSSLTGLELFNAGKNAFTGTLPAEWGSLRRLSFLDVSVNQLTGPIPESWSSMSRLYSLYLQSNQLTGAIPAGLGVWNLNSVNITNNQFCGCVSSLWNSSSRITLSADPPMRAVDCMSANACAVDESSSVAERATLAFLQGFAVSMPSLQSTWADTRYCAWPGVACTMDKDVSLDFAAVALTAVGSLPALSDSVDGSLIPLTQVRISGKGAMVSGPLPVSWSRLTQLREVTLAGNALTGPLPAQWSSLTGLQKLNLGSNALSGSLLAKWSTLTGLQTLNLENNALTGPLPAQWSSLAALTSLDLHANQLSGSLPATWSDISRLQSLNLGKNQFTGTLPESWGLMAQLKHLALNNNQLTGRIPTAVGALLLTTVDISSNQFCGCVSSLWNSSSTITLTADPPMRAWNWRRVSACPVDESSSAAERATLAFLQGFAVSMPSLQSVWADTRYCAWPGVLCNTDDTVALDFADVALTAVGSLPALSDSVEWRTVLVTRVQISGKGAMVSGPLPASWSRLTQLREVNLAGNALTGLLPAEWGSRWGLSSLDVSVNQLTGPIPESWSGLTSLRYLFLQSNQLTGTIPAGLGARYLDEVDIRKNQFCGCVSSLWNSSSRITLSADPAMRAWNCLRVSACPVDESSSPADRAALAVLQGFAVSMPSLRSVWADTRYCAWPGVVCTVDKTVTLDFADVALTTAGSLPELSDSVNGSLIPLTQVQISGKGAMVSGSLPASWGRLTQLREVNLAGNALTGPLPAKWRTLPWVQTLNLSNKALSGSLPSEWSAWTGLWSLSLGSNSLNGSLPAEWGSFTWLRAVDLSNNELTGSVPETWSSLKLLETVHLGNNVLTGSLPAEWSAFRWLRALNMSRNALNGTLPADWSSMQRLTSLDLSVNKVHGTLPEEWSNMIALRQLHLNNNELTGTIPSRMGLLSLSTVDISRNQFTGCAPRQWRESCSLTLRADPPMTTGVCAIDKSCDEKSGSAASSTSEECEVTGCETCDDGAPHVCAQCQSGYIQRKGGLCEKDSSGAAADARAGAVVAAVTCAVLAFSLVMTL